MRRLKQTCLGSPGNASLINGGSAAQLKESYRIIHANYRARFGAMEFLLMKIASRPLKAKINLFG